MTGGRAAPAGTLLQEMLPARSWHLLRQPAWPWLCLAILLLLLLELTSRYAPGLLLPGRRKEPKS
jgi:hypothetical protein